MSVLVKGMEMPTRCEDCFCYRHNAEYDYAYCNISSVNVLGHGAARLNNCPLVPVPPHGRLIDVEELTNRVGSYMPIKWTYEYGSVVSLNDIYHAPTIIPAEEIC